jgi:hypothetical protein
MSNGLANHEVAFRLVVSAGIVISVLITMGLHISALQETENKGLLFPFLRTHKPIDITSQFWFGVVVIKNYLKNCMAAAGSGYINTYCLLFYKVNFIAFVIIFFKFAYL